GIRLVEGKEETMPVSFQVPSRCGPRHCGQSAAIRGATIDNINHAISSCIALCRLTSIRTPIWLWSCLSHCQTPIQVAMTNAAPGMATRESTGACKQQNCRTVFAKKAVPALFLVLEQQKSEKPG